jgi:hypothetical protein
MQQEMSMDWIQLIIGTVLGLLLPLIAKNIQTSYLSRQLELRKRAFSPENIYNWLIKYYDLHHSLNDLYNCKIGRFERRIPFITDLRWQFNHTISDKSNDILDYSESEKSNFYINEKLLEQRKRFGQTIFNEPILYIDYIEDLNDTIKLHVKKCSYFETATSLIELEEETYKAYKKNNFKNLKLRDNCFSNLAITKQIFHRPINMGCLASFVIKTETSYEILINTRSYSTMTYGGAEAVLPQFGLIPIDGEQKKAQNLIFYNFIKEYCEELFSFDELILKSNVKSTNPTWFYKLDQASELISLWEKGDFNLEYLGFGFDALNGSALITVMALINDVNTGENLKSQIRANWEVESDSKDSIQFVDIKDKKLEEWLRLNKYQYGSAFVISRTLQKLTANCR